MLRLTILLLAILLLGIAPPLCAEEEAGKTSVAAPDGAEPLPPGQGDERTRAEEGGAAGQETGFIDSAHERISSGVLGTARWLDSFFADPRFENEESKTRIRVRFSLFAEKDSPAEYDAKVNLRLDLPVLEDRLHLLIGGAPEDENDDDFQALTGREGEKPALATSDEDFSTSLRYFLERSLLRNISLRGGVKWRNGLPTFFLEPRYRQSVPLDSWLFRFTQRVFGFTDGRTGVRTTFDFERELTKTLFFRTTADGSWSSEEDGYFYSLSFAFYKRYSARRVLVYSWANSFRTRPVHQLDTTVLSARYRQRIFRDWLFYEVIPQVAFPEDRDYQATPGILLRLELLFGYYPKLPPPPKE